MKTIFTFLIGFLYSAILFANHGTRLSISTVSNSELKVEIDGQRYRMNENGLSIRDLQRGYHTVHIYREGRAKKGRWWDVFGNRNQRQTLYNSRIFLREGYHLDLLINRFGKVFSDERRIDYNDDWYDEDDDYWKDRKRDRDWNDDRDHRDDRNDRDYRDRYDRGMNDREFSQAKETLRREWFENNRMISAKQIFDDNRMSSQQVKEILQLFSFENNKLELAKHAYRNTVDRNNYFIVNDVFAFSSSREELARYIRNYR